MNILIAPNSFKNNLNSFQIAAIIKQAFQSVNQHYKIEIQPLADGGDGTLDVLSKNFEGKSIKKNVLNPIGKAVESRYFLCDNKCAIIELAEASGLKLLQKSELNPNIATTYGTGELIKDAIDNGAKKIIVGIGGSATIDGGIGASIALGVKYLGMNGEVLNELNDILDFCSVIDYANVKMKDIEFLILSDVKNPMFGKNGGIKIYGKQKGATSNLIAKRELQTDRFIRILEQQSNKTVRNDEYLGASGGFPVVFKALFNAKILNGAHYILKTIKLEEKIKIADIIITAEGRYDSQTIEGKLPFAVAELAKKYNKPVILITGQTEYWNNDYFDGIFPIINKPNTIENLLLESEKLIYHTSRQLALLISKINAKNE